MLTAHFRPLRSTRLIDNAWGWSGACLWAAIWVGVAAPSAEAQTPFTTAKVTRIENVVSYGDIKDGRSVTRPAVVADVLRERNFLLTETEGRAELQYADGSVVRIGQNTVFSFEADTRTLALKQGTFIFFVPKGSGGGRIKTPSLTAAITGTVGKVSRDMIAILEGEITLIPSGKKVSAGFFARSNPDGSITIARFDPRAATEGRLMRFNGRMPGFREDGLGVGGLQPGQTLDTRQLSIIEGQQRTTGSPSGVERSGGDPNGDPNGDANAQKPDQKKEEENNPPQVVPPSNEPPPSPPPEEPPRE